MLQISNFGAHNCELGVLTARIQLLTNRKFKPNILAPHFSSKKSSPKKPTSNPRTTALPALADKV